MTDERLQKVLAAAGIASRRGAEELIAAGRVTVDGRIAGLGDRADPAMHVIAVDGRRLGAAAAPRYVALNKPVGVTSTVSDPHAARTVVDMVPRELAGNARLYPVGRLDADSEGLIILTNDGDWAQRILHPRHEIEREYAAGVDRPLTSAALAALRTGVDLEEGPARVVAVRPATGTETRKLLDLLEPAERGDSDLVWYRITLAQGWKRQVRRMFGTVGAPVRRLARVRFGTLRLDGLPPGRSRPLTRAEVSRLSTLGTSAGAGPRPPQDRKPPARPTTRPPATPSRSPTRRPPTRPADPS
jgi:23S rRNA pseudouridine2605 synthase